MKTITIEVNGKSLVAEVEPRMHLADFLRDGLNLTGTHIGCEHGVCGACTVLIDGEIARSCITYAVACGRAQVRTIEGFGDDPVMARLREAFSRHHALQCGYCTPGMLITARDLIRRRGDIPEQEIRLEMSGNLCRCTGYVGIVEAIRAVMVEGPRFNSEIADASTTSPRRDAAAPASVSPIDGGTPKTDRAGPLPALPVGVDAGLTRLSQSFTIASPRAEVWNAMSNLELVATCMPGVVLDGPPQDGRFTGRIAVKLGPIAANLTGHGRVTLHDVEHRAVIEGEGSDRNSSSRARGSLEYRLSEVTAATTRVDVVIAYALTGPLAQFSRGSLVRDLVSRLTKAFAETLEARLANPDASFEPVALHPLTLLLDVVWARIKTALGLK